MIKLKTKLPGPKAAALIGRDKKVVSPSYTRSYPLVANSGKDIWITDPDGNVFMDFAAGIATCSTGHCHPEVVESINDQAGKLIHMSGTDFYYEPQIELSEKLADISTNVLGSENIKVFFGNSGAEAVEAALKLARWFTKRPINIAFYGAFHGRTMGALSLTGSKYVQKEHFYPMLPNVIHVPYAYCYRCPYNLKYPGCDIECVKYIEEYVLGKIAPSEQVAAIFVEPIQGEGGYLVPPKKFHKRLANLANKHGILLVADEVQSGMGRTGKMFAMEHFGVRPDIVTLAKGIASGMPLGIAIAPSSIMKWRPGAHASTFGGNPISCRAALTTISLLEHGLMRNAAEQGKYLMDGLRKLQLKCECIGDVRGKGLMVAIEIVDPDFGIQKDPETRDLIVMEAFYKGLLLLGCGENSIRFSPPLTASKMDIDTCLTIVEEVLNDLH